ncbi:MAG: DUF1015 domain-containing protein [Flavobacteriales bacterium CG03_land_8_20_14_0_80_35_15]|nr:MAG: DUF1015 domain-containing protein [Flavobacteriales bacterium CG03_land_8_20_14_0_80_35_15]PJA06817.1 MAG: DUF1015 domain-containing protein [Flavobacteriales bacterium CG_4_10_14_0_2_um_filter_35_18]
MAVIRPFKAVRPTRDKAALLTTSSYETYSNEELNSILKYNPFSFLHILKPGFKFQLSPKGDERFRLVRNRYIEFKENRFFTSDAKASYYLHQQTYKKEVFWGFIATSSIADYQSGLIKKHEATLKEREVLFGKYLETTGFNAEPVLIAYPDTDLLTVVYEKYQQKRAEYEFTTNKKHQHLFWVIENDEDIKLITGAFAKMDAVYIADGHHRCASSNYLANLMKQNNPNHTGLENYNFFMSYLIPESRLKITSFNRFIKSLNGLTKDEFLIKLDAHFRIENRGKQLYIPSKKHHFSMYLEGAYYSLYLRKSFYQIHTPLDDLDAQLLFITILKPILGIDDLSNSHQIKYLPAILNQMQLKDEVDSGKYQVAFGLVPTSVSQLKLVANANLMMPPKSTYIEPKLRSGLTIYEF